MKKNNKQKPLNLSVSNTGVVYPKACDVEINASDLKLELITFKKAIKNEINISLMVTLLSLWIVVFTANFQDILDGKIKGHDLFVLFCGFTTLITIFTIKPILIIFFRFIT